MTAKQALLDVARGYRRDAYRCWELGMSQRASMYEAKARKLELKAERLP